MPRMLIGFVRDADGQDIIEYALLAAFVSLASVAVLMLIGPQVSAAYGRISGSLGVATGS